VEREFVCAGRQAASGVNKPKFAGHDGICVGRSVSWGQPHFMVPIRRL